MGRFGFCRLSPRSPRSPLPSLLRPVATFATCAAIRGIAKPPVWPVSAKPSRVARVGSGRACDWLQVYQPLQRRAAEDVRRVGGSDLLEDLTPRRHPLHPLRCSAVLRPCCTVCNLLDASQSAQAVACARADAAHIRARRASGC